MQGARGGVRMGCPSLLPPFLVSSSPPFPCVHLLQLSVSPLTLSGSYRQQFKGPLLNANSSGTTTACRRTHRSEGGLEAEDKRKRFICEFSCVSFMSFIYIYIYKKRVMSNRGSWWMTWEVCKLLRRNKGGEMFLLASFLVQAVHVTVAPLPFCLLHSPSCTWLLSRAKITWLCSLLLGSNC